jgi:hypothetical protein
MRGLLNERLMRLAAPRAILAQQAADTQPAYPLASWANHIFDESGMPGKQQYLANAAGGKISHRLLLDLLITSRSVKNPQYIQKVNSQLIGDDLLREVIMQTSIGNVITYEHLQMQRGLAIMAASAAASDINATSRAQIQVVRQSAAELED